MKTFAPNWNMLFLEDQKEGAKLMPNNYLRINGVQPPVDFYTDEEIKELIKLGYNIEDSPS